MDLRFSSDVLDSAILCYQLRTEEPLDEVVLACLCELKELRGRLTCNDFNNGYNQALEDFANALIDGEQNEEFVYNIEKIVERLRK